MRQIRDMSILVVDITNACHRQCSNCTRFCGHYDKTFFMEPALFKRTLDSLEGFGGHVGILGGEPLLHPEWGRLVECMAESGRRKKASLGFRYEAMNRDYQEFAKLHRWMETAVCGGAGFILFTAAPPSFYPKYESIHDIFHDIRLNDHSSLCFHQPILVGRKDLGIGDAEFAVLRDRCWLQNRWSASVTPKGCFFCEMAGTLDMLFDGPGGKPVEPGWWNRDLSEFADQFHWCDLCGMPLKTYGRNANDIVDDVSPSLRKRLERLNTPKLKANGVVDFDPSLAARMDGGHIGRDMATTSGNYFPDGEKRVGESAGRLKPSGVWVVLPVADATAGQALPATLERLRPSGVGAVVVAPRALEDDVSAAVAGYGNLRTLWVDFEGHALTPGDAVVRAADTCGLRDWLVFAEDGAVLPDGFAERVTRLYLNPGYLFDCRPASSGDAVLFSKAASAVRRLGYDRLRACSTPDDLRRAWGEKTMALEPDFDRRPDADDIPRLRELAFAEYARDVGFLERLRGLFDGQVMPEADILVLHSAFVFHTLSIARLVEGMGYRVHILSTRRFKEFFDGWLPEDRCIYFDQSHFDFAAQKDLRRALGERVRFAGALVPYSLGAATVKPIDDYTDALKTAEDLGGRTLAVINIRREFARPEYDIWAGEA